MRQIGRLCLLVALGATACQSASPSMTEPEAGAGAGGAGGAGGSGPDFIDCSAETRATPYKPGLAETSISGAWIVKLVKNTFAVNGAALAQAPTKGTDTWTIEVDDAVTAMPVDGIVTGVSPWMPDHRHGTTPVMVSAAGPGTYTLAPLYLYMSGYWEITVDLTSSAGGAPTDSAMFPICVPD
jgi:hypothetical protein